LAVGDYKFKAGYLGDGNYNAVNSTIDEPLHVNPAIPTVTTLLSKTSITLGDSVNDTVTVTGLGGSFPDPTGTVIFQVSTDGGSTWTAFGATKVLVAGSATSDSYTPLAASTASISYYFRAVYSGDDNYQGKTSDNTAEPLTVGPAIPTVVTALSSSSINLGQSVNDTVTVTGLGGSFPGPTGTVTFWVQVPGSAVFVQFGGSVSLVAGSATSDNYKPAIPGKYYFKAVYSGDDNYLGSESGATAEPVDVLSVLVPTRTIGFWQTHTNFTEWVFDHKLGGTITIDSGTSHAKTINTYGKLFGAFYCSIPKNSDRTKRPSIDQNRTILLQQLVGAILNHAANGMPLQIDQKTGLDIITAGNNAYSGNNGTEMMRVKDLLDSYNGSGEGLDFPAGLPPQGSATPKISQAIANIKFWDSPL
jgi:hypothetical protein